MMRRTAIDHDGRTRRRATVSAAELRRDYRTGFKAELDQRELWTYYAMRPVSFPVAALLIRLGIGANQVTGLSLVALVAGCLLLGFGSTGLALLGTVLLSGWLVLDCADGTIARYHKSFSPYGAYLDTVSGYAAYALVYLAAGVGAYNRPDQILLERLAAGGPGLDAGTWLLLGAWASIAALWSRLAFQKFRSTFDGTEVRRHQVLDASAGGAVVAGRGLRQVGNDLLNLSGVLLPLLFVAVLVGALDLFLLFTALGNTAALVVTMRWLLRRAASASTSAR
jgi:phosphatidylglycerophosphate synthase